MGKARRGRMQLVDFPRWLRALLVAAIVLFFCNAVVLLAQTVGFLGTWSWKLDGGLATLFDAVIGLGLAGWQARRGFTNLIRSQENQATLDIEKEKRDREIERRTLTAALLAEFTSLHQQADAICKAARAIEVNYRAMPDHPALETKFTFPHLKAPVYQANISKLGLLEVTPAADVIMAAWAATEYLPTTEGPISHSMFVELHSVHTMGMEFWRDDLLHVIRRLRASEGQCEDPGPLTEDRERRMREFETRSGPAASMPMNT
jgi:hypothetical protein